MVELFKGVDEAQEILGAVLRDGVAGVSGMRTEVRQKLVEVRELARQVGYQSLSAQLTFDHPETELAYPYDVNRYSRDEALEAVRAVYDAGLP